MKVEWVPAHEPGEVTKAAERAAHVLAAAGLVIHPTETVYGIGGDASPDSNALIARIKDRPADQPLILLILDVGAAREFLPALEWTPTAQALAARFWPGPLSIVVRCPGAPPGIAGPDGGVALRATPDPVARAILRAWGRPMSSTSANLAGQPPARTAAEAARLVEGRSDLADLTDPAVLVVEGGPRGASPPSTVVSLLEPTARVLREGPIRADEIARVLQEITNR